VVAARQVADFPDGVADSKLLKRHKREMLFDLLRQSCQFGEGWVRPVEIDRLGLTGAQKLGLKRALRALKVNYYEEIIMDGPINYFSRRYRKVQCLIDADALVPIVSAASIYAKVLRDRFMIELGSRHPRYGFESHVGYATPEHLHALDRFGALKRIHRQFFEPIYRLHEMQLWPE